MRRLLAILAITAAGTLGVLGTGASDDDSGTTKYWVELDNAFGLIEGADLKVAGVRAGKIDDIQLDERHMRARVGISVREGFGDLRRDAFCETRPQSLIGEYFIDCRPGTSPQRLPDGGTVPVRRTATTVPLDLITNIMRRPYRERFSIIYNELGAGLAARGEDLNETIRRASPALRETDRVLAILREQRHTIRDLYDDADKVLKALADNRRDVSRFVAEARDTAGVSASRGRYVRRNFRLLPRFLSELRPTMDLLGQSAARQEGALRNLNTNRHLLRRFLGQLEPFAEGSRPALRTLGEAAEQGRVAAKAAVPRIKELEHLAKPLPELGKNAAITLEHLDDRRFATEKDPRSPGGQGHTGLETFLRYIFAQSQAINIYDGTGYILKVAAFLDNTCARYINAEDAKNPQYDRCAAILGPNRPGINSPDPTAGPEQPARRRRASRKQAAPQPAAQAPAAAPQTNEAPEQQPKAPELPSVQLPKAVQEALDKIVPGGLGLEGGGLPEVGGVGARDTSTESLLDFLLGS